MSRLFDIADNYNKVLNMLYDEDIDEQMIFDTIESIDGEFDDKAENYGKIITELQMVSEEKKKQSARIMAQATVLDNRIENLKSRLFLSMKKVGKSKITTPLFTFAIQKNGGLLPLKIDGDVPEEYQKTTVTVKNDNDKIRQALENGEELPFAHFEARGESLRIR